MSGDLTSSPGYSSTMARLEEVKRSSAEGEDYWMARDINAILGYPTWREFEDVIERAWKAFEGNQLDPSHQIVQTHKMMEVGRGAQRQGEDFFLSRAACYLIAMNGDPSKPQIAAAQAYFAVQTRRMELAEEQSHDEKRLELRGKVAQNAGHLP
jgi:DNA-damage-inducible protein D